MTEAQPVVLRTYFLSNSSYMVELGKKMLAAAEDYRRTGAQTFEAGALKGEHPSADWAAAGLLIGRAMHHLDESIPNGQRDRTAAALGALLIGVELLESAMNRRQVFPARLVVGDQAPQAPQPDPATSPVFGLAKEYMNRVAAAGSAVDVAPLLRPDVAEGAVANGLDNPVNVVAPGTILPVDKGAVGGSGTGG